MAFMMPVVKKNYTLYANPADPRQRRTSDQTDISRRPGPHQNTPSGSGRRRKVKSEGQSQSTSPGNVSSAQLGHSVPRTKPMEMFMRRGRGSAPALVPVQTAVYSSSLQHQAPTTGGARPSTSAPTGNSPAKGSFQSQSSVSSESSSESAAVTGKFHSKLVQRLRKTFRIKDPEPTST